MIFKFDSSVLFLIALKQSLGEQEAQFLARLEVLRTHSLHPSVLVIGFLAFFYVGTEDLNQALSVCRARAMTN